MTVRNFSVRSNAIRNARLVFGKAAKEGVEFKVSGTKGTGFTWEGLVPAPEKVVSPPVAPDAPVKRAAAKASVPAKRSRRVRSKARTSKARTAVKRRAVTKKGGKKYLGPKIRENTKRLKLYNMLAAPGGASIKELTKSLRWQQHTVRGAISTMNSEIFKKRKNKVNSFKDAVRGRVYQMA